jgi:transcription-repair coupling factor (superfamily II helicase)
LIFKDNPLKASCRTLLGGIPDGVDALALAELVSMTGSAGGGPHLHVASDDRRLEQLRGVLSVIVPEMEIIPFPAWDCLPYDRVSPNADVLGDRMHALMRLKAGIEGPTLVLTTVNAVLQRVPPRDAVGGTTLSLKPGVRVALDELATYLEARGFGRTGTVREPGEYAFRGGIVDIFPPASDRPVRLDLFGDEIEKLRYFDPATQLSEDECREMALEPVSELTLDEAGVQRFREGYRALFGGGSGDPVYEAVSERQRVAGVEHWLPLLYGRMETLFDYLPDAPVTIDHHGGDAVTARLETIADFYDARKSFADARKSGDGGEAVYNPLPPDRLYLTEEDWNSAIHTIPNGWFSPFAAAPEAENATVLDCGGRRGQEFAAARLAATGDKGGDRSDSVFDAVVGAVGRSFERGNRVAIAGYSAGSAERLSTLLREHGLSTAERVSTWADFLALPDRTVGLFVLGLEHGFTLDGFTLITEQDILGERMVQSRPRRRQAEAFISNASELSPGDYVVHVEHGIGRFEGLETITAGDAPHDCLRLTYDGGDRLFVPVESVEVLSRYGSADTAASLDRLGGAAWQSRKSRLKKRLQEMAEELIRIAAQRALAPARKINAHSSPYEEFCARFPYQETADQQGAIEDVLDSLSAGRPMDRLVCGDVGFGKTEIALRAAFATVMEGGQVAVVAPTTLLCRQHFATFKARFQGFPVRIGQLSRMVSAKEQAETRKGIADGQVDIAIGTHALLGKSIEFKDLALLIIDEEQHFGVAHKERLKKLRTDVHVLTLTATPIPRTLQMALTGVKEMSIIATPPVDRLAVRTFVTPFDSVIIREAIQRERFRGGQIFYVCPRIQHLEEVEATLRELVPDVRIAVAHGQMTPTALGDVMNRFYDGAVDLLLSTQIVESGLDIPSANTLIVHRADMLGLAQLYQLRGRIGRSKQRGYCYLTLPADGKMTDAAVRRLEVMQSLDALGAGFTLASHDLDIRGAGNLLGDEQSGHIREVGVELYQHMLEEAVAEARGMSVAGQDWSPQINIGTPVLIPESYVTDLDARLGLYRRLAALEEAGEVEAFAAELIDRFGPVPDEVENLLQVIAIKQLCRHAGVETLDAGPKGAVIRFHNDEFADPVALVQFIQAQSGQASVRPDHRLVIRREWGHAGTRLRGSRQLVAKLAEMAAG